MEKIRKAVFPVCGLDTSYSPATKAIPMEMLPILDRPLVQYVVDEAREAGIEEFIFVTGRNKAVIEKYFDFDYELADTLKKSGKSDIAKAYQDDLLAPGKAVFIHRQAQRGLGHAILCARDLVGDEPFAVLLPTMMIRSKTACLKQMAELDRKPGEAIVAVEEVHSHHAANHGIATSTTLADGRIEVTGISESFQDKPRVVGKQEKGRQRGRQGGLNSKTPVAIEQQHGFDFIEPEMTPDRAEPEQTSLNMAIAGRYIFPPTIFDVLESQKVDPGKEIELTRAIGQLAKTRAVSALRFEGMSFDCALQSGLVIANMIYALDQQTISDELVDAFIKTKLRSRIGELLDTNALAELADTLQRVADNKRA